MIKLDANRKGHHKKTFVLDPDMGGIRYEPSKKTSRCKLTSSCYLLDHSFCKDYLESSRKICAMCTHRKVGRSAMRTSVKSLKKITQSKYAR